MSPSVERAIEAEESEEPFEQLMVSFAFNRFMDEAVDRLTTLGLSDTAAVEVLFEIASHCASEGVLPSFPEDPSDFLRVGDWLVRAHDFGFVDFVLEALGSDGL